MKPTHPTTQARDIATLIDNDPIMASQIKEFIRPERLLELLDILKDIPSATIRNELLERDETNVLKQMQNLT